MERSLFEKLVSEAIAEIPEKFLKRLENMAVVVEEEPNKEQRKKLKLRGDEVLLGLYEGVPQTKRGPNYGMVLPDKITIFQRPIEESADSVGEIKEIVKKTVWHEIAHHFGSDERGAGRAQKNS